MSNSYSIVGIMSGTSMDGVDLAYVTFSSDEEGNWQYNVHATKSVAYAQKRFDSLKVSVDFSVEEMCRFDKDLGRYFGETVNDFIDEFQLDKSKIDAIASHGHTVFHQPQNGFTLQIGCGATMASVTGLIVINDFRTKDVIHGGQGAPLVPIGDSLLFSDRAEAFLNIGGFTNVCFPRNPVLAFDISPGNLPLNEICQTHFQQLYDHNGEIAASGTMIPKLFDELNELNYYSQSAPKSLGTEWLKNEFNPLLKNFANENPKDRLHTITKHIAYQIGSTLKKNSIQSVMITGGGAKNAFLIQSILENFEGDVNLPSHELIDFKEAIVFGFLGALYLSGGENTIPSVTGAKKAVRAGVLHLP